MAYGLPRRHFRHLVNRRMHRLALAVDRAIRAMREAFAPPSQDATCRREGLYALLAGGRRAVCVEGLESRTLLSNTWFVATWGSDKNPGTIIAPFRTVQQAADVAYGGDTVEIRAGTYRETVTPRHSGSSSAPIVFEAYNGESVTISGADPIGGWTNTGGGIWKAAMPVDLGEGNNQLFVDGRMINEARWPNTSLDPSHPTLARASSATHSGDSATIYDPSLTQPNGFWDGAVIHFTPGQEWTSQTGTITSSGPGYISFSYLSLDKYEQPSAGNPYYITGTFKALDAAGEWYRDPRSGQVYAAMPSSDNPASHDVEAKERAYAFDLSGQHDITIRDVNVFAATINTDSGSYDTVINHITAQYTSQFLMLPHGWDVPAHTGIQLSGADSVLENSSIAFSAGDGVMVAGANSRVTNNLIHDVDYDASDNAAIRVTASGTEIDHNTIYNAGRSGIVHTASGLKILYNVVHDVGLQTTEAGGIYTVHTSGGGTEIAYNEIYNMHSGGYGQTALFLDNYSNDYVVHDNIVWNVDTALKLNYTCNNDNIYNNTLAGTQYSVFTNLQGDWNGTQLYNNVFSDKAVFNRGASAWDNVTTAAAGRGTGSFTAGVGGTVAVDPAPSVSHSPTPSTNSSGSHPSTGGSGAQSSSTGSGAQSSSTGSGTGSDSTTTLTIPFTGPLPWNTTAPVVASQGASASAAPMTGPMPAPAPSTAKEWSALLSADRAAIKQAVAQRQKQFSAWAALNRADAAALVLAEHELSAARQAARASRAELPPVGMSDLIAKLDAIRQEMAATALAIANGRKTDFTGIKFAQQKLAADLKVMHKTH